MPPSSRATIGIAVATASDSNATRVTVRTRPIVRLRRPAENRPPSTTSGSTRGPSAEPSCIGGDGIRLREAGDHGLGQRPAGSWIARQPDPDLVAGERHVARPDTGQAQADSSWSAAERRQEAHRGRPAQCPETDDKLAVLT